MKKPLSSLLRLCIAAALIAAGTACSEPSNTTAAATPATPAAPARPAPAPVGAGDTASSLGARITAEIGDAACDNASQCRTLPVGAKPCGGPAGFLPWSTKRSNGELLAKLAAEQAAEERKHNEKSGMMSTCMVEQDPGATCTAGKCVLMQRSLGGSDAR
ncbi:hypothetical protein F2P45_32760 [Massilia sp. CCM 8733]|uniref:DUF4189 domain-containing protein n=1 Tax=Massilia mucilaginosa TaxID=2609282 RepID=A0ABX0P4P9_9BURK|nr:hypothetical protein [Massilia mucilaginosa]NHZ93735.1 hypothetical protein [Massilia mucilaginosa]